VALLADFLGLPPPTRLQLSPELRLPRVLAGMADAYVVKGDLATGVSLNGRRVMAAAVKLREVAHPSLYAEAA